MQINKKIAIISLAIFLLIIVISSAIFYYAKHRAKPAKEIRQPEELLQSPKSGIMTKADFEQFKKTQTEKSIASYNAKFPDTVAGMLSIGSDGKTTISQNGIDYLVNPARPRQFYADVGIEDGMKVVVQGRIVANTIELGNIFQAK